jgi:hypothetical protein
MPLKSTLVHEQKPIASGLTSTLQIPPFGKIYSLPLQFLLSSGAVASVAQIIAQIANIRLTINGKDIINCSPEKLFAVYSSFGTFVQNPAGTNGVVELNLGRMIFNDAEIRNAFGYGSLGVANIQIQVTAGVVPAPPNDIVSVQAFSTRTQEQEKLGIHFKLMNFPQSFNSTGDHTVDTLPRDPDSAYVAVFADDGAAGTISFGECRVDNVTVIERCPSAVNVQLNAENRLAQPAGHFMYGFTDGSPTSQLPMRNVKDLRFITTFAVAPGAGGYNMTALTIAGYPTT